jgi:hypothetical protein
MMNRELRMTKDFFYAFCGIAVLSFSICVAQPISSQREHDQIRQFSLTHKLSAGRLAFPESTAPAYSTSLPETVRILAAMVEFSPDNDPLTTGNGLFDMSTTAGQIIDPPPHDKAYFENHLLFLRNYWERVTNGTLIVIGDVVDTVIQLPREMSFYSPPSNSTTNLELARLVHDTWRAVDSIRGGSINFSSYHSFCIFHAGVGRDIDLTPIFGFDPTPFDIPSLYFDLFGLRRAFGSDYRGVAMRVGTPDSFYITNSMVLPETESRSIPAVGGQVLLQLGINGLLAASFGSHLGLPDLFDTRTGRSGIGRFGLMDGESIFSWGGVFPPEPSAWEKYFLDRARGLGMLHVINAPADSSEQNLSAVSLSGVEPDTILRVPISAKEYFLVENRNRDARQDSTTVTRVYNGNTIVQTFARDTAGFHAFDQSSLYGVVIDVDEFDFSLPGGVTEQGEFFDGGILIWHVDENIIVANYATNAVNAGSRKGIDLEEADGSQDIGQPYEFLDPGSGSESGTPLDFWFNGNSAPVYRNEFSQTSYPNSQSNSGAYSHVSMNNFSVRGPRMTMRVQVGDERIKFLNGFPKSAGERLNTPSLTLASLDGDEFPEITVVTTGISVPQPQLGGSIVTVGPGRIYSWKSDGTPTLPFTGSNGLFALRQAFGSFSGAPAVKEINSDGLNEVIIGGAPGFSTISGDIIAYSPMYDPLDSLAHRLFVQNLSNDVTTSPVAGDSIIVLGGARGLVFYWKPVPNSVDSIQIISDTSTITGVSKFVGAEQFVATGRDGSVTILSVADSANIVRSANFGRNIVGPAVSGLFGPNAQVHIAFATSDGSVYLLDSLLNTAEGFPVNAGGTIVHPPALADLNGDGLRDIIVFAGNKMYAYNYIGASLDYFPFAVRSTTLLRSPPIVSDVDGDSKVEVVGVTEDGLVFAYNGMGRLAPGFPLQAGTGNQSAAVFYLRLPNPFFQPIALAVASSEDGTVSAWVTGGFDVRGPLVPTVQPWPQYLKDEQHTGLAIEPLVGMPVSSEFFPRERAYNWPNPVYDGKTFIRYYLNNDATVRIKIYDLAGELVDDLTGSGTGGIDHDVEWNVAGIQSGVYFGHIEAESGGHRGVAIIKIAVVK